MSFIMSFLYFFQLLNNWPRMLLFAWDSALNPYVTTLSMEMRTMHGEQPRLWETTADVRRDSQSWLASVSVCDDVHIRQQPLQGLVFKWELLKESRLLQTAVTRNCSWDVDLQEKVVHEVYLSVSVNDSVQFVARRELQLETTFWMAALGDSFASGQGNPDVAAGSGHPARWMNESCHRSTKAFVVRAFRARELRQPSQPHALTFLACSGASVDRGILATTAVNGVAQMTVVEQLTKERGAPPDVLLMTLGGNDIGFTDIVSLLQNGDTPSVAGLVDMRFFYASHQLDRVAARIEALGVRRVVVVPYYDVSRNQRGHIDASCGKFEQISTASLILAEKRVWQRLNALLKAKTGRYNWEFVDGVPEVFRRRGICSTNSLIRTANESLRLQGDQLGSWHPNEEAHLLVSRVVSSYL